MAAAVWLHWEKLLKFSCLHHIFTHAWMHMAHMDTVNIIPCAILTFVKQHTEQSIQILPTKAEEHSVKLGELSN